MENGGIDLFSIGKETFSKNIVQLKNDKKLLKLLSQNIQLFIKSIEDNKNFLKKISNEINKYSPIDRTFCFTKKFQIILNIHYSYFNNFFEKSQKPLEQLNEHINSNLKNISEFLTDIHDVSENIKLKSNFFDNQNGLLLNLFQDVENSIIEDYFKIKSKNSKEQLIYECRKSENDFILLSRDINNMINEYKSKYNSKMKQLKNEMLELNKNINIDILNIVQIAKNELNDSMVLLDNEIQSLKNNDLNNMEYNDSFKKYLIYQLKEDELKDLLKPNKYKISIINKDKIKLQNSNLDVNSLDIYNIVDIFYSYHFEMIDKTVYNSAIEKNKLNVVENIGKLLGYDFNKKKKKKIEKFSEKEINTFINFLFTKEDYIIKFLTCLNNYRGNGNLEFSEEQFNIFKIIFSKASDYLLKNNNEKIYYFLIILSQTFYKIIEGKKYYLVNEIKEKQFFLQINFWSEFIEKMINAELMKLDHILNDNNITEEKKNSRKNDIIVSKLFSIVPSLNYFNLEKNSINSILLPIINKYNLSEEKKQILFSMLNVFKN